MAPAAQLLAFVTQLLEEVGKQPPPGFDEHTSLLRSELLDSFAILSIVTWIEEEMGCQLDLADIDFLEEWDSVERIVAFAERGLPCSGGRSHHE